MVTTPEGVIVATVRRHGVGWAWRIVAHGQWDFGVNSGTMDSIAGAKKAASAAMREVEEKVRRQRRAAGQRRRGRT